jgi:hypothetical protein
MAFIPVVTTSMNCDPFIAILATIPFQGTSMTMKIPDGVNRAG